MASIITPAQNNEALAIAFIPDDCTYCRCAIVPGERWVRERIYEPFSANSPRYRRYHADLFAGEALSCWEKHQMELEIAQSVPNRRTREM